MKMKGQLTFICLVWCIILSTVNYSPVNGRSLAQAQADGICHTDLLTATPDTNISDVTNIALGLFFSIENTNTAQTADISAFSVYLDTTLDSFNFTISTLDREYTTIGAGSMGADSWVEIANGVDVSLDTDFSLDEDGRSLIPFASFGGSVESVSIPPSGIKSFYMKFSVSVMAVDDDTTIPGGDNDIDSSSSVGLMTHVGRKDIFSGIGIIPKDNTELDFFFTPSRFVGKVWSRLETCAPSASPTPAPSYAPSDSPSAMPSAPPTPAPSISPTPPPTKLNSIKVSDNKLVLNFGRSRRQLSNYRSLQECLTQAERNLVQVQLQQQADNTYADVGLEVSYNSIIIKSIEANSDCSKITFFYDQEIVYNTVAGDETTISEIIQMPMDTTAKQQAYINNLTENASPGSKLKIEMYTEEIEVTEQGLSTRMPTSSPSVSTAPTESPSESPSDSPTQRPSISLRPTVSSAPSWSPTVSPSISIKPTISVSPTTQPSMSPTISTAPTQGPSGIPSMQPSISQAPTESPSNVPSLSPSESPSDVPSNRPSTTLNYMTVEYSFDISYPPGEDHTQIKQDIEGNVTESLQNILSDTSDILFPLRQNYGLAFSKEEDANTFVYEQEDAVDCVNEGPEGNVCTRFVIRVYFQHERGISEGLVTGWLLEVSDRIMGTLQGSYTGDESVRTVQVMILQDVESYPDDLDAVCEVVEEILANSTVIESSNYTILAVECLGFEFVYEVPGLFKNRHHRGLRSLQELNDASVEFRVTGEYTQANRVDEEVKDEEFDTLLEDSINKDVGKEIGDTLKEREVVAMKGSTEVESVTKITTAPTKAPIEQGNLPSVYITESSSNFASGSAGLAVIITCSLVVALVGGFLFYKGIQRSKMEKEDDFYWEEDSFSNYTNDDEAKMYASGHKGMPIQDETSSGTPEEEAVVLPDHYTGAETNIFGSQVGSRNADADDDWLDEKMQIHADMTANDRSQSLRKLNDFDDRLQRKLDQRSGSQGESAEETLNEFDQRMQRKLNGRDGAQRGRSPASRSSSFEEKLQNKLSKSDNELKRRSSSGSGSSFEQRLQRKMSEGSLSGRSPSPSQRGISSSPSSRQLDNFEARIAAKSKGEDMSRSRSPSPGLSFNERMKNKLNEDKRSDSRSSSRQSNNSRASFEDRLRAKMSEDSANRGRPSRGTLASSSSESSRHLDDLEKRIAAKQKESNSSRDSSPKNTLSYEQRLRSKLSNGSGSSDSSSSRRLDTFEEKIARKSREESNSRSRPDALTSSRSSPSSRRLNSFEERIAAKSREGNASKSRDSSPLVSYEERLERKLSESTRSTSAPRPSLSSTPSSRRLDSFEERIAAKSRENNRQSASRGLSPSGTSYEERLNKKLSEGRSSSAPRTSLSSSMNSLDSYEARIAAKTKEGKRSASRDSSPSMSYEERLNRKLSQSTTSAPRRSKPSSRLSSSMTSMDSFEERIAAKSREADKKSRMSASSSPSSDSFEERIARKSRDAGTSSSMSSRRTAPLSSSTSCIDSFEARIAAKSSQGSTGRSKPRSPSPSMRSSQLDSFESKIQAKLDSQDRKKSRFDEVFAKAQERNTMKDLSSGPDRTQQRLEKNARSRSTSPGVLKSTDSARLLDSFEARIAEKSRQGSRGSSPSVSKSEFDERLQRKLEGSAGQGVSSSSKESSKQSFEAKLEAKLASQRGNK